MLFSGLFFLVSISVAAVPLFLGMPGAAFLSLVSFLLLIMVSWNEARQASAASPVRWKLLGFACAVSILLCLLGGEGHFFYANSDWLYRDAVLSDLARQPWPVTYRFQNQDWLLRAPLGMYVLPALVEKLSLYPVADTALLVQNVVIFTLLFYFIVPPNRPTRAGIIIITVFCVFGGWHIIGFLLRFLAVRGPDDTASFFHAVTSPQMHIEWWGTPFFDYSAAISQIFWVPNHTIPGWLFACLYLRWIRSEATPGTVMAAIPILAFWSPLAAAGMLPFAAHAGLKSLLNRDVTLTDVVIVIGGMIAALPMLFYERLGAGSVQHGFQTEEPFFWIFYLFFISLMIVPFFCLVWWGRAGRRTVYDPALLIAAASLLLLPFYRFGVVNDLITRGSTPALAILATVLGIQCATISGRWAWTGFAVGSLAIGGITGALEINRALVLPRNPPPDCNLVQIWQAHDPGLSLAHYLIPAEAVPPWAMTPPPAAAQTDATSECPRKR